jgi:hypothetical protein
VFDRRRSFRRKAVLGAAALLTLSFVAIAAAANGKSQAKPTLTIAYAATCGNLNPIGYSPTCPTSSRTRR